MSESRIVIFEFSHHFRPNCIHSPKFSSFITGIFAAIIAIPPMIITIIITVIVAIIIHIKGLPSRSIRTFYPRNNSKLPFIIKTHDSIQIFLPSFITRKAEFWPIQTIFSRVCSSPSSISPLLYRQTNRTIKILTIKSRISHSNRKIRIFISLETRTRNIDKIRLIISILKCWISLARICKIKSIYQNKVAIRQVCCQFVPLISSIITKISATLIELYRTCIWKFQSTAQIA